MWLQRELTLRGRRRGCHLITRELIDAMPEIGGVRVGLCHLLLRHTSAALTLNENASPDVRDDLRTWLDAAVPKRFGWTHTLEGTDDMPAHVKTSLLDVTLTLPISDGRLALGTWQGLYLVEHRDAAGPRSLLVTVWGESGD